MTKLSMNNDGANMCFDRKEITFTLLIRTKNEEKNIERILTALQSQDFSGFEIIIIDSGSTDNTLEKAGKYPVKIYKIDPEKFTYGFSLNYGFQKAQGEFVISLSADALPVTKNMLKIILADFHDEKVAAVMCKTLPWPDCNPFDKRGLIKKYGIHKKEITEGPPLIFSNADSAIRKVVWEKVHFDETVTGVEEYDWVKKVRQLNYKVIYEPDAEVYHSHNESLKQIYRRHYRETYGLKVLNCKKYTSLFYISADLIIGTMYDMMYVLFKRESVKWFFFAPFRKLAINCGRLRSMFKKSQTIKKNIS